MLPFMKTNETICDGTKNLDIETLYGLFQKISTETRSGLLKSMTSNSGFLSGRWDMSEQLALALRFIKGCDVPDGCHWKLIESYRQVTVEKFRIFLEEQRDEEENADLQA